MLGFKNLKFEGWITNIENDIAFINVVDFDGERSTMEISKKELVDSNIDFKSGTIFSITLKQYWGVEKLVFKPIKKPSMSKEEFDEMMDYYEKEYGDI